MLADVQIAEIRASARRGALLLDERGPEGWAGLVNPDKLRMHSTSLCVLGQSMDGPSFPLMRRSSYMAKLDRLDISPYDQIHYGFALWAHIAQADGAWKVLADAWRFEILIRTATTPVPADEQEMLILAV